MEIILASVFGFATGLFASKKYHDKKYTVNIGERIVNDVLNLSLTGEYALLSNITLPIVDMSSISGTSQIDHVVISTRGLFVIETKFYSGSIVGLANSKQWHQYTRFDKKTFQNPLRQNYSHLKAIEKITGLPSSSMFNVVVFSGDAIFKSEMPANVIRSKELREYIESQPDNALTMEDVYMLSGMLQTHRLPASEITDKRHIDYLNSRFTNAKHKKGLHVAAPFYLRL